MKYPKGNAWTALLMMLPFAALLAAHARYYYPFISDDALISLRYAARLLHGDGLTWTDGQPVEGYSNLLWILLVAFLGLFRVDLIDAARVLGMLGMGVALFALSYTYITREGLRRSVIPILVALLFFTLGAPTAVWAIGGLEQPLCAALIAVSVLLLYAAIEDGPPGAIAWLSFVEGLLCLARPDGPIFAGTAAASFVVVGWLARRRRVVRDALLILLFPVLLYGGQLGFRLYYYGEVVPNTALVKFAPSSRHLDAGRVYLLEGLKVLAPLSVLALACLLGLLAAARTRARGICLLITALAWSGYLVVIGGDNFPAYRHFIPLMVIFAFGLAEAFALAMPALSRRPAYLCGLLGLVLALFVPYTDRQFNAKRNQRAMTERWEWDGKEVALLLKKAFGPQQPLLAVTVAGCLPYWSELPSLDMLGLNDYYLPRHPPKDFGKGWVGHELGDGKYVLDRRPDIIVFNVGTEPAFRTGEELDRSAEFRDRYVPVTVITVPSLYEAIVYIDRYSPKIGIKATESDIVVPAFLFEGAAAHLSKFDRLVVPVANARPVHATFHSDPRLDWFVEVKGSDPKAVRSELKQDGASLSVVLQTTGAAPIEVEEVVLRRAPSTSADRSARLSTSSR